MTKDQRQKRIVSIVNQRRSVSVAELTRLIPQVSAITVRRDLAELDEAGAVKRTHGGAAIPDTVLVQFPGSASRGEEAMDEWSAISHADAVILPPLTGATGAMLRRTILRRGVPFIAESAPQDEAAYLGPDNHRAGQDLAAHAARELENGDDIRLLIVCHRELPNTSARTEGFLSTLKTHLGDRLASVTRVDGKGSYRVARRVAKEALQADPAINVAFAINDHSARAVLDALDDTGAEASIYAVGGESPESLSALLSDGRVRAICGLFPEIAGTLAIDLVQRDLAGLQPVHSCITPHRVITASTLADFYRPGAANEAGRSPVDNLAAVLAPDYVPLVAPVAVKAKRRPRIAFMPHFPSHDWYRQLIDAMRTRCDELGLVLDIAPPMQAAAKELSRIRAQMAQIAVELIEPGNTVIIGEGEAGLRLADEIVGRVAQDGLGDITVITNALDVMERLHDIQGITVLTVAGEYQASDRCLVGPAVGALLEGVRADLLFLSVAGVTADFGISAADQRLALVAQRFMAVSRRVVAFADHTLIGNEASHRIAGIERVNSLITDIDAVPSDRVALRASGLDILIAGDAGDDPAGEGNDAVPATPPVRSNTVFKGRKL